MNAKYSSLFYWMSFSLTVVPALTPPQRKIRGQEEGRRSTSGQPVHCWETAFSSKSKAKIKPHGAHALYLRLAEPGVSHALPLRTEKRR